MSQNKKTKTKWGWDKNLHKGRPEISTTQPESLTKTWITASLKVNPSDSTRSELGYCSTELVYCSQQYPHTLPSPQRQTQRKFFEAWKIIPSLAHISTRDRRLHNVNCRDGKFHSGLGTMASSSHFTVFSTGISGRQGGNNNSPAPARWMTDSPWDKLQSSSTTTLSSVSADTIFRR